MNLAKFTPDGRLALSVFFIFFFVIVSTVAALAETQDTAIEVGSFLQWFVGLVGAGLIGAVSIAGVLVKRTLEPFVGAQVAASARDALEQAIQYGLAKALEGLDDALEDLTLDGRNKAVTDAANYVLRRIPDAVASLGIDEEGVVELVQTRLADRINRDRLILDGVSNAMMDSLN